MTPNQYRRYRRNDNLIAIVGSYLVLVALCFTFVSVGGCGLLEDAFGTALSDIEGWDLSACVESSAGRETCSELFFDNEELILGGQTLVETIINGLPDVTSNGSVGG